jgi:myo-inositol-1-phosphate synthase
MGQTPLRVGIVGVGNCASAFVQGLSFYKDASANATPPGLMHVDLGGYHISDVIVVSAFDVHTEKVGRTLAEAIFVAPNNTIRFAQPLGSKVRVLRGPVMDGVGRYVADDIPIADVPVVDVAAELIQSHTEVLVSYLPVGSQQASEFYANEALKAGCAYVNCIPVFLASNRDWARRFADRGLPIIGDDIKSQVGATILHRNLVNLMRERGVHLDRTYQLNFGGNADFQNMLERERLVSKKISKTQAVISQFDTALPAGDVHVGPSDHVPWLTDRKWAHIRLEGTGFGGVPLSMEVKLEVWDSPNSAGIVIDAVRCAKLALDRGIGGPLSGPSSYFMKSPPVQVTDEEARQQVTRFIDGDDFF